MQRNIKAVARPVITVTRIPWWHGDAWPIILALRGGRPIYRTRRDIAIESPVGDSHTGTAFLQTGS